MPEYAASEYDKDLPTLAVLLKDACPQLVERLSKYFEDSNNLNLSSQIKMAGVYSKRLYGTPEKFQFDTGPVPLLNYEQRMAADFKIDNEKEVDVDLSGSLVKVQINGFGHVNQLTVSHWPDLFGSLQKYMLMEPGVITEPIIIPVRSKQEIEDWENLLVKILQKEIAKDLEVGRYGPDLFVKCTSPCKDVGDFYASCMENEVILHCNLAHTHMSVQRMIINGFKDPWAEVLHETVRKFIDFTNDRLVISKTYKPDGSLFCTGWGGREQQPSQNEIQFLQKYIEREGGPFTIAYWVFSHKLKTFVVELNQ
jgi:hypothetical protein